MKREIKFRAWDKSRAAYRTQQNLLDDICRFHREDGSHFDVNLWRFLMTVSQQDNFVLEQYTGLKDKNGKEIYEGDIVCVFRLKTENVYLENGMILHSAVEKTNSSDVVFMIGKIIFRNGQFICFNNEERLSSLYVSIFCNEVIGNIHENPELLK